MSAGRKDAAYTLLGSLFIALLMFIANWFGGIPKPGLPTSSAPRSAGSESGSETQEEVAAGRLKVIGISDGDTITVLKDGQPLKIRFAGIDTPEKGQPFGNNAKEALSSRVGGRHVKVVVRETDRYGRSIGDIYDDEGHVNKWLVEGGFAWHYKAYSDDADLARAEDEAKRAGRGLWADKNPIPPWNWRKLTKVERDRYR